MSGVSHHVTLQHLLHLVPSLSVMVGPHVDIVGVEVFPIEELLDWASEETGEPADLAQVTHVPHRGAGADGHQEEYQYENQHVSSKT